MPAKVVCPTCHMSLNAPEDLLGQAVKCEECGSTFTARAPARPRPASADPDRESKSRYRRREEDDEDDRRPRKSSRFEDDDEDDRPRRRRAKKKGDNALPFILAGGGLVLFVLLAGGAGLYFLLSSSKAKRTDPAQPVANNNPGGFAPLPAAAPLPNNPPPVRPAPADPGNKPTAGAQKVRLSNPRWSRGGFGGDFQVDYEFTAGRPVGMYSLKWKSADGSTGSANLHPGPFDGNSGTWNIHVIGAMGRGRGGGMEIWVEEGGVGFIPGTKVSNTVTLN